MRGWPENNKILCSSVHTSYGAYPSVRSLPTNAKKKDLHRTIMPGVHAKPVCSLAVAEWHPCTAHFGFLEFIAQLWHVRSCGT